MKGVSVLQTWRERGALDSGNRCPENTEQVSHSLWPDGCVQWNIVALRDKSLLNPTVTPTGDRGGGAEWGLEGVVLEKC